MGCLCILPMGSIYGIWAPTSFKWCEITLLTRVINPVYLFLRPFTVFIYSMYTDRRHNNGISMDGISARKLHTSSTSTVINVQRWKHRRCWVHPGRLTWNIQITHLERKMIFQTSMIMFHVNLQGCICRYFIGRAEMHHFRHCSKVPPHLERPRKQIIYTLEAQRVSTSFNSQESLSKINTPPIHK